jgi:pantoate--beta-alanine ligase
MQTIRQATALRGVVRGWREDKLSVALVPTMGNLHAGHLALVGKARRLADRTAVTIFVNPTQFTAGEDYERYPRTFEQDSRLLSEAGADIVFVPELRDLYPEGLDRTTQVQVPALDNILCGASRPGHFTGVATVVTKLFNLVQPDMAVFGEKDYQQLLVIKRLVKDLCMGITIHSAPTVRESDGLAMSSRNGYLTPDERRQAPVLYQTLKAAAETIQSGETDFVSIEGQGTATLKQAGFRPDYFSISTAHDLSPPSETNTHLMILAAAWLGQTRLIDNLSVLRT